MATAKITSNVNHRKPNSEVYTTLHYTTLHTHTHTHTHTHHTQTDRQTHARTHAHTQTHTHTTSSDLQAHGSDLQGIWRVYFTLKALSEITTFAVLKDDDIIVDVTNSTLTTSLTRSERERERER